MKAHVYEGMFLLDPNRASSDWNTAVKELQGLLTNRQAKILHLSKWDERRLAYEVEGHRKGVYVLTYFEAPPSSIAQVERDCQLSSLVLRALILKIDPRHQEAMLAKAKEGVRAPAEEPRRRPSADAPAREEAPPAASEGPDENATA